MSRDSYRRFHGYSEPESISGHVKREGLKAITWTDAKGNTHRISANGKITMS